MPTLWTDWLDGKSKDPNLPEPEKCGHRSQERENSAKQDADYLLQVDLALLEIFSLQRYQLITSRCPRVDLVIKHIRPGCHLLQSL